MKKIATALAVAAAALLSNAAMAQGYTGASFGSGHVNVECDDGLNCDNSGTAFKVLSGYQFGNGFAGELGYLSFGKAKASAPGVSLEVEAAGFLLAAAYHAEVARNFSLTARVGLMSLKTEISASVAGLGSASDSETNTKPYFGIAATYALTKAWKVELAADFSRAEYEGEDASVRAVTAGARFEF